jgi:hypothetical protein
MSANKDAPDVLLDELSGAMDTGLPELDLAQAEALDDLQLLRETRADGLQREHERLSLKLGEDHPRVAELAARIADNQEFVRGLALVTARARVETPQVDKQTWVLYGFIRDEELQGVPNVTIALYDEQGNWAQQLGYASTRADGSFSLRARNLDRLNPPLFLHVLNQQASHLFADDTPLTPEAGSGLYHEVIIGDAPVGTPPAPSRNEPLPEADAWVVRGRVTDAGGRGVGGLIVRLYDKDFFFHDRLGEAETNADGNYSLVYRTEDFRDYIERKPDLFVVVLDRQGRKLYTSKGAVRHEAGRVEIIDVTLGGK